MPAKQVLLGSGQWRLLRREAREESLRRIRRPESLQGQWLRVARRYCSKRMLRAGRLRPVAKHEEVHGCRVLVGRSQAPCRHRGLCVKR